MTIINIDLKDLKAKVQEFKNEKTMGQEIAEEIAKNQEFSTSYMSASVNEEALHSQMVLPSSDVCSQIKLVALDLDGTSLRDDKTFSPRLIKVIHQLQEQGVYVAICSGRAPESVINFAKDLKLESNHGYCICFNGGSIINLKDINKDLFISTLNAQDLIDLEALARKNGAVVHAYSTRRVLLTESDVIFTKMEIAASMQPFEKIKFPEEVRADEEAYKLIAVGASETLDKVRKACPDSFNQRFNIARTHANFLEFMTHGCSKGSTLEELCRLLNIELKNVIAFGDAENDIEMIQCAGVGVAMANAMPALKAVAKYKTLTHMDDGVARYLEKVFNLEA